jgi:hypothetical protein
MDARRSRLQRAAQLVARCYAAVSATASVFFQWNRLAPSSRSSATSWTASQAQGEDGAAHPRRSAPDGSSCCRPALDQSGVHEQVHEGDAGLDASDAGELGDCSRHRLGVERGGVPVAGQDAAGLDRSRGRGGAVHQFGHVSRRAR